METERACYLIRQHVYANLSHRLGTRPFLSHLEKVCRPGVQMSYTLITEHPACSSPACQLQTSMAAVQVPGPEAHRSAASDRLLTPLPLEMVYQLLQGLAAPHVQSNGNAFYNTPWLA